METDHGIVGRNGKQCREKYTLLTVGIIIILIQPSNIVNGHMMKNNDLYNYNRS